MRSAKEEDIISLDIYFDYLWPYVYKAAVWLQRVKEELGPKLIINWRYFSLEQVNNEHEPQWKIWEQPEDDESRGRRAFQAAEAARQQGKTAFDRFHMSLLRARHEQERDIADMDTLLAVADESNLDMIRFQKDLAESRLLNKLAEDHIFAVENLGIFGTPTLAFSQSQVVFVKLSAAPPLEECLSVFMEIYHLAGRRQYIQEIKRPQQI